MFEIVYGGVEGEECLDSRLVLGSLGKYMHVEIVTSLRQAARQASLVEVKIKALS